jgi:hypothetical protein
MADHDQCRRRQVGAEALEHFLEGRNHENHDHAVMMKATTMTAIG